MPTTITRRPISEVVPSTRRSKVIFILCVVAIFALSIESAIEAAIGGNKLLLIVPLGGFAGIGMVALGLVNFENFVLTTIAIRASLDITKPQSGNSGAAGVGNPTAAGLDPAGALAVLFLLVAFFWFLTRMRARSQVATRIHPSRCVDHLHTHRIPEHHQLGASERQSARGDPCRGCSDDARGPRGDARRP